MAIQLDDGSMAKSVCNMLVQARACGGLKTKHRLIEYSVFKDVCY